jgi:hypothetical protein
MAESPPTTRRKVSPKHVLFSEILSVTSAMRKNSRWASSTHVAGPRDASLGSNLGLRISTSSYSAQTNLRGSKEAELMAGFQEVKRIIKDVTGMLTVFITSHISPYFAQTWTQSNFLSSSRRFLRSSDHRYPQDQSPLQPCRHCIVSLSLASLIPFRLASSMPWSNSAALFRIVNSKQVIPLEMKLFS